MKTAFITGGYGQLGSDLILSLSHAGYHVIAPPREDLDISNFRELRARLVLLKPDVLINTAAFHHVDQCEIDVERANLINTEAPAFMARVCRELNTRFVHFSTDYVFDGSKNSPYLEDDAPSPLNIYGKTKALGEERIAIEYYNHLIIRVSALYGKNPCRAKNGLNFIQLMLKLAQEKGQVKVVDDEFVSPTSTQNIAAQLPALISEDYNGIVHMTSEGSCTWFEFAREIFEYANRSVSLYKASHKDFPAKTPRPKYSVLENTILKNRGINIMMPWKQALHLYLDEMNLK